MINGAGKLAGGEEEEGGGMKYQGQMDQECVPICDAINRIPGVQTIESCCGHAERPFSVDLYVSKLTHLPILLYYLDSCHVGFDWTCKVYTGCAMWGVKWQVSSLVSGKEAYRQAQMIADKINEFIDDNLKADYIVAKTQVSGEIEVSTVFLGIDHNWSEEGSPIFFETMVFGGELDEKQACYTTWDQAEKGHASIVKLIKLAEEIDD